MERERTREETEDLRARLSEAEETLDAIRSGGVDALLVHTDAGARVFTLQSAETPYRVFVEHMQEGAAMLSSDGSVLWANGRFAAMVDAEPDALVGADLAALVEPEQRGELRDAVAAAALGTVRVEVGLRHGSAAAPVQLTLGALAETVDGGLCVVATDLSDRRRMERLRESEERYRRAVTAAPLPILIVAEDGEVLAASEALLRQTGRSRDELPTFGAFLERCLGAAAGDRLRALVADAFRDDGSIPEEEITVRVDDGGARTWILSGAPPERASDGRRHLVLFAQDVTDRRHAEVERQRLLESERLAREEAERAGRMKDEFLATLSHELRTPLNAILGWVRLLRVGGLDDADREQAYEVIERNTRAQAQLISDLLDMSRIVSGKLSLSFVELDVQEVVAAALDTVRTVADAKGVALTAAGSGGPDRVSGDPDRLQQVVWNLLANAIEFTPEGGRVSVAVHGGPETVEVRVSDTGKGIDPDSLPLLFQRFRQLDGTTTRSHQGLGLGLAIVKELVELHGGHVRAESPGLGHGATFVVTLPAAGARPDPAPTSPDGAEDPAHATLDGLQVLVVDDHRDGLELVRRVLEGRGAHVRTATSAREALAALRTAVPDCLLCDIGMPGEDGYDLLRHVRALPPHAGGHVPAAALTAFARPEERDRALAEGFQLHIAKPVDVATLPRLVARLARG